MNKMLQSFIVGIGMVCMSLHAGETSEPTVKVSMRYMNNKYQSLKNILEQEDDGAAVLQALKRKCDDHRYKLSKEYKKILKRHNVLIKKSYGCLNIKKHYVVCKLVKSGLIKLCLDDHAKNEEDVLQSVDQTDPSQVQSSIEDIEQIV